MRWLAVLVLLLLTGCSSLRESAHGATAADAATTAVGVGTGLATEVNPLIGTPMALAGVMLARLAAVEVINAHMDEPHRTEVLASLSSLWWGMSVSNLIVLLTASTPVGLATGAMVGLALWQSTALEREFAAICARERQSNPRLRCVFTPTT